MTSDNCAYFLKYVTVCSVSHNVHDLISRFCRETFPQLTSAWLSSKQTEKNCGCCKAQTYSNPVVTHCQVSRAWQHTAIHAAHWNDCLCSSLTCSLYPDKKDRYSAIAMSVPLIGVLGLWCLTCLFSQCKTSAAGVLLSVMAEAKQHSKCNSRCMKTYHQVMKQKFPGLTQLLVDQHVQEVINEVTCGERHCWGATSPLSWWIHQNVTHCFDNQSLELIKWVKWTLLPWRPQPSCVLEELFISANPTPSSPAAVSMVTAIQNIGQIMKSWR